jgi:acyl-CoA reductase-like NAD-dependent aldehyde dehydrogenase
MAVATDREFALEDEKDAIRIANDVRYGLMATVWTGDLETKSVIVSTGARPINPFGL